jgi:outer membrane lipoprotein carrier protein
MKLLLLSLTLISFTTSAKTLVPPTFSANFEQSLISAASGKEKKSYGKLDYKYPGHIRFEITSPDPKLFVSNPQKSWIYDPPFVPGEEGQVTVQPSSKLPLTRLLDSLNHGLDKSKLFTHEFKGQELILSFKGETLKDTGLKEVRLKAGKDAKAITKLAEFDQMVLRYSDGREVNLRLIDLKEGTSFTGEHFTFTVPPKTKVITN